MNIFIREIKSNLKPLIFWCIGMAVLIASGMGKFVGFSSDGNSINDILGTMPKSLKTIIGIGDLDISKMAGYFAMLFLYVIILAAVHAASLGATIISKEERDKTFEFLYVRPVTRAKIFFEKFAAALVNIIILNVVTLVVSLGMVAKMTKDDVTNEILLLFASMFFIQLIFLTVGLAISVIIKNSKSASGITSSIVLGTFLLSILADINKNLDFLKYLTPFKYFDSKFIVKTGIEPIYIILSCIIVVGAIFTTLFFHQRKDLKV